MTEPAPYPEAARRAAARLVHRRVIGSGSSATSSSTYRAIGKPSRSSTVCDGAVPSSVFASPTSRYPRQHRHPVIHSRHPNELTDHSTGTAQSKQRDRHRTEQANATRGRRTRRRWPNPSRSCGSCRHGTLLRLSSPSVPPATENTTSVPHGPRMTGCVREACGSATGGFWCWSRVVSVDRGQRQRVRHRVGRRHRVPAVRGPALSLVHRPQP